MSGKITTLTLSKIFASLTEFLDSKYRVQLYNVKSFSIKPACSAETNFLSSIYAIQMCLDLLRNPAEDHQNANTEDEYRLICKSQLLDEKGTTNNLEKYYWNILFTKEKMVFDILEKLNELSSEYGKLSPKMHHYYSEGEDYACIIMDDLVSDGFYTPNTLGDGLTLDECKTIMKNLARLHALSLVLEGKEGCPLPNNYEICTTETLFSSGVEPVSKMTYNSFLGFLKLTEEFRPDLLPHLKKIDDDENIWNRLCELVKPERSSFPVFCHGDPRTNNIFIEKASKLHGKGNSNATTGGNISKSCSKGEHQQEKSSLKEPDLRFIDFQLTRYSSGLTDLQYVLYICTSRKFREKHTDTALETYYNEFRAVLAHFPDVRLLHSQIVENWTLEKLKEEYEQFHMWGFLVSVILLPMILLRPGDIDKSMSQMTRAERGQFFKDGRIELVFNIGSKNDAMRERLFELCDEMVAKNVISTTHDSNL